LSDQITWQAVVASVLLVALAWACRRDDRRLAFCWGLLLPVDYITGVHTAVFDVARYAGILWLCWRVRPTLSASANKTVVHLAAAIGTVAVVRGVFAVPRTDENSMVFAGVMLVSTACAALLAQRVRVHGAVAMGYLAGVTLSAVVSIMQALHIPTLRAGNTESQRYPGVSTYTMLITWQLAFGLIMATYLAATAPPRSRRRYLALAVIAILSLAMVTNGAQGGLIGVGAAVVAVAWINRHRLTWSSVGRFTAIGLVLVGGVAAVVAVAGVDIPTIDGIAGKGKGGYRNETARWDVAVEGMRELRNHPLLGMGRTNFMDKYTIAPHFLPIDSGVTAGVLGFLVAAYLLFHLLRLLLRGPADRRPETVAGFAMLAAMCANTVTESYGPFIGLSRVSVLFLAVVAVKGQLAADRDRQGAAAVAPVTEPDVDARWAPGARLGRFARPRASATGG
jgi:hypothetical protein